jgi:hypothetical protein
MTAAEETDSYHAQPSQIWAITARAGCRAGSQK